MDVSKYLNPPPDACPRCDGCGKIANDDSETPWWQWEALPWQWEALPWPSNLSVAIGLVKPLPCPACKGTGKKP